MEQRETEGVLDFAVVFRDKALQMRVDGGSTVRDLGEQLLARTGVAPHTLRLVLPSSKRGAAIAAISPFSEQDSSMSLQQAGFHGGQVVRMMGALAREISEMETLSNKERIVGFKEEEERARRRSEYGHGVNSLPRGSYVFNDFRTLQLPGIELNPPPSKALEIMHRLASDHGIVAIMNKHRWMVGVMTELAPVGYVGISPKCLLGFNKNRGEEISLRLRTDDLKGFRKYESIKKTLLHELAHMVHDEHDENFHALDKQLNDEAIALDWTRSRSQNLGGPKGYDPVPTDLGAAGTSKGHILGGNRSTEFVAPSEAAARAAFFRSASLAAAEPGDTNYLMEKPAEESDGRQKHGEGEAVTVLGEGFGADDGEHDFDSDLNLTKYVKLEPVLEEKVDTHTQINSRSPFQPLRLEPDPDDASEQLRSEPDPDDAVEHLRIQPDPDDVEMVILETDPNDAVAKLRLEPDPDAVKLRREPYLDDSELLTSEPDPDDAVAKLRLEPNPDETELLTSEPGPDDAVAKLRLEPDPDDTEVRTSEPHSHDGSESIPDNMDASHTIELGGGLSGTKRSYEPDPDDSSMTVDEADLYSMELRRIQEATTAASIRLGEALEKLKQQAGPSRAVMSAQTLSKILRNVAEHPNDRKFRRLRKTNPTFMQLVGQYEGALEFLAAVGFTEGESEEEPGGMSTDFLVLRRNDPGLLWLARSSLDAACLA